MKNYSKGTSREIYQITKEIEQLNDDIERLSFRVSSKNQIGNRYRVISNKEKRLKKFQLQLSFILKSLAISKTTECHHPFQISLKEACQGMAIARQIYQNIIDLAENQ